MPSSFSVHVVVLLSIGYLGWSIPSASAQSPLVIDGRDAEVGRDGPCFDDANRFVDCGNGTVTDSVTGLIWLQRATCVDYPDTGGTNLADHWPDAMRAAAALTAPLCGLSDGSVAGDWRLPTDEEWAATLAPAALGCVAAVGPAWTDDAGTGCFGTGAGSSFLLVGNVVYWSSTATEIGSSTNSAYSADLTDGAVEKLLKLTPNRSIWVLRDAY